MLKWFSVAFFCLGALCLLSAGRLLAPNRWSPVNGVISTPDLSISVPFTVGFPGSYKLEVSTPITESPDAVALPELPPISCHLTLTIINNEGWKVSKDIISLRHTSRYAFGNIDCYDGGSFDLPQRGAYVVQLKTIGPAPFAKAGALFSLTRKENSADAMVFGGLVKLVGMGLIIMGVIGLLVWSFRGRRHSTEGQRG
jgi:hypothetical protein